MEEVQKVISMKDTKINTNIFTNPFNVGTVVDNNDPTNSYRVRVKIDLIHDNIPNDKLPWAARVGPGFMGFGNADIDHAIPEVGTKVLTLFIANDPNSILYLGTLYKNNSATPSGDDYLGSYGIYTQNGEFIGVDKVNKTLKMIYEGKIDISKITQATISVTGEIKVKAGSTTLDAATNTITGNVKINGKLDVTGQITCDADVKAGSGSVGLLTHTHPGIFPGPSSTAPGQG